MIAGSLLNIRGRIEAACARAGRDPREVLLVAVSKGRPLASIEEAAAAGLVNIGENRVQEAKMKIEALTPTIGRTLTWHLIGHLQTNKAKDAVRLFDLIQSVDSVRLAEEINSCALREGKVQDCLVEIKVSPEPSKTGIDRVDAPRALDEMSKCANIRILGLMTVAPIVVHPEDARPYFRALRELRDSLNAARAVAAPLKVLSMGMSDDFEVAVEEGATMVRVGRALFEEGA